MMNENDESLESELERCKKLIEEALEAALPVENEDYSKLLEAMRYTLLNGGKRIRGIISLKFAQAVGATIQDALGAACAIELLHAYTLIHDDLPCMDDSDMRRGKPANHKKYGESTAMLAGDAMQAAAFEILLKSDHQPENLIKMTLTLAQAAGHHGVCAGQYLDLDGVGKLLTADELIEINRLKTTALICAAAVMGVYAGGGSASQVDAAKKYSSCIGLAFQARDDILDCISTEDEMGKPVGTDMVNDKITLATLMGIEDCEQLVSKQTNEAIRALEGHFDNSEFLKSFADYLANRKS